MCIYFLFMKTVWILFNGGWSSKAKLKDACPITYWGENILTFARALINKILLYGVFFFSCPSVSRIPSTEKTRIENTGESCETMQGTSCLKGKERGGDGGGKGEREKKKRKKKYAEQRRKLVIELAGCGKCGVKNTVESRRPSQVFTGTLWNSFERMKLLSNAPLQPTDDMQPTGLESN